MMVTRSNQEAPLYAFGFHDNPVLLADGSRLDVLEVVRTVPGKRIVCKCVWNAQSVYAKIFVGRDAERYANRDERGVLLLQKSGIKTPPLLYKVNLSDRQGTVLVFAEIADAVNAEQAQLVMNKDERFKLASLLVQEVAHHHQNNLLQTDLYFKNFLIKDQVIYTLDGDGIRALSPLFKKHRKLQNLATLFSKFDALDQEWINVLYAQYCLWTGIKSSLSDEVRICNLARKIRHQAASAYADKKVFRNCTDVRVGRNFKYFEAVAAGFDIQNDALKSLDVLLENPLGNIKNGSTCTVARVALGNRQVVVKRYNIKSFWHGFSRAFRKSRATVSWANAYRLMILNVATPMPLALVEERLGVVRRRAYFLSEYINALDVKQFFAQPLALEDKRRVARSLAVLFYKLYLLRISHGDCKSSNVKILNLQPVLIDLDSMQTSFSCWLGDWWFERKHVADIKRFLQNWKDDVETKRLLKQAFQVEYLSRDSDRGGEILFRAGVL